MNLKRKKIWMVFWLGCLLAGGLFIHGAEAATYYVDAESGNDSWTGTTPETAWATIAKANNTLVAGDTVFVFSGTYEEAISPVNSGSEGQLITYAAAPEAMAIVRQVSLTNRDYIRVTGFEVTHSGTSRTYAVTLYGVDHCEILYNLIHHTNGQGIRNNAYYGNSNYNIIRGNTLVWIGCPSDAPGSCEGHNAINLQGQYNLIEYNDISHSLDYIDTFGGFNIIRNNVLRNFDNSDFPDGDGDGAHVDTFQPFGIAGDLSDWNIFENNWAVDNLEANSHFLQVRDETLSGEKDFIVRGNVAYRFGSYVAQFGAIDNVRMYNNTFADFAYIYPDDSKGWSTVGFNEENGTDYSLGSQLFNNIFFRVTRPATSNIIYVAPGSSAVTSHNACEQTGTHSSCAVTANINFSNYPLDDFTLQSSSAARDAGRAMTTVASANGSGSTVVVDDAGFFTDGFGITHGDQVRIGSNSPVEVTGIDYGTDTLTLAPSVSWTNGDPVVLAHQDATPDIGALAYQSGGYSLSATYEKNGSELAVTPSNPSLVRFIEVFHDGLPIGERWSAPWTFTGVGDGLVVVKVYHQFASLSPVIDANSEDNDFISPAGPTGLYIE